LISSAINIAANRDHLTVLSQSWDCSLTYHWYQTFQMCLFNWD